MRRIGSARSNFFAIDDPEARLYGAESLATWSATHICPTRALWRFWDPDPRNQLANEAVKSEVAWHTPPDGLLVAGRRTSAATHLCCYGANWGRSRQSWGGQILLKRRRYFKSSQLLLQNPNKLFGGWKVSPHATSVNLLTDTRRASRQISENTKESRACTASKPQRRRLITPSAENSFWLIAVTKLQIVPACQQCNREKARLEDYLMVVLGFGGRHPDATLSTVGSAPGHRV